MNSSWPYWQISDLPCSLVQHRWLPPAIYRQQREFKLRVRRGVLEGWRQAIPSCWWPSRMHHNLRDFKRRHRQPREEEQDDRNSSGSFRQPRGGDGHDERSARAGAISFVTFDVILKTDEFGCYGIATKKKQNQQQVLSWATLLIESATVRTSPTQS